MQIVGIPMVTLESRKDIVGLRWCDGEQPRKQGLFLVECVSLAANMKILQRRFHRRTFFFREVAVLGTFRNETENIEELLDSTMAVLQHAYGVIESAVWFSTDLNCHLSPLLTRYLRYQLSD